MLRLSLRKSLGALGALPLIALSACTASDAATALPDPITVKKALSRMPGVSDV